MKMVRVRMRLALKHLGDYDSRESARNLLLFLDTIDLDPIAVIASAICCGVRSDSR